MSTTTTTVAESMLLALHELIAQQHLVQHRSEPLDVFNSLIDVEVDVVAGTLTIDFDNDEEVFGFTFKLTHQHTRTHSADELQLGIAQGYIEQCPGCGARPGDGITPGCDDEMGCGFWNALEQELLNPSPSTHHQHHQPNRYFSTIDNRWHDVGE